MACPVDLGGSQGCSHGLPLPRQLRAPEVCSLPSRGVVRRRRLDLGNRGGKCSPLEQSFVQLFFQAAQGGEARLGQMGALEVKAKGCSPSLCFSSEGFPLRHLSANSWHSKGLRSQPPSNWDRHEEGLLLPPSRSGRVSAQPVSWGSTPALPSPSKTFQLGRLAGFLGPDCARTAAAPVFSLGQPRRRAVGVELTGQSCLCTSVLNPSLFAPLRLSQITQLGGKWRVSRPSVPTKVARGKAP